MTATQPSVDLTRIVSVAEFEPLARAVMEPAAWDYVAGGAWDEQSIARATVGWFRFLSPTTAEAVPGGRS